MVRCLNPVVQVSKFTKRWLRACTVMEAHSEVTFAIMVPNTRSGIEKNLVHINRLKKFLKDEIVRYSGIGSTINDESPRCDNSSVCDHRIIGIVILRLMRASLVTIIIQPTGGGSINLNVDNLNVMPPNV